MEYKTCTTCKNSKLLSEFHKYKNSKDGHTHRCKICVSRKKITLNDVKKCTDCDETKTLDNFHNRKLGKFGKSSVCKKCQNIKSKIYREVNIENVKKVRSKWNAEKRKNDPIYKLIINSRCRIYDFLKKRNISKSNKTFFIIGCTPQFLKEFLEKQFQDGMNWDNYGLYGWHIDHIIPLSSAKNKEDIYKLCHYSNLQPLWCYQNLKKSDKFIN